MNSIFFVLRLASTPSVESTGLFVSPAKKPTPDRKFMWRPLAMAFKFESAEDARAFWKLCPILQSMSVVSLTAAFFDSVKDRWKVVPYV